MTSFKFAAVAVILIAQIIGAPAGAADDPADQGRRIFAEVVRRDSGYGDQQARVSMQLRRKSGAATTRVMDIATLEVANDGTRTIVAFNSPLDVTGTKVLTYSHQADNDEQWIYLPAFKRVKQISDASKTASFMGSEFTYEDINSLNPQLDKFSYRYVKTEDLAGTACFVVERVPRYARSAYARQIVWITQANFVVLKVDYYDTKNALLKTLTLGQHRQYLQSFWRPAEMVMTNHQSGDATVLTWADYKLKNGLAANDFTASALKR